MYTNHLVFRCINPNLEAFTRCTRNIKISKFFCQRGFRHYKRMPIRPTSDLRIYQIVFHGDSMRHLTMLARNRTAFLRTPPRAHVERVRGKVHSAFRAVEIEGEVLTTPARSGSIASLR